VFEPFMGAKSRENPANLKPVGTGPVQVRRLQAGRHAARRRPTPNYHVPNQPFFDALEIKGGGDATSAARAVLQTGEYDLAWNLAVEDEILKRLEAAARARCSSTPAATSSSSALNVTDPWNEVDGERASAKSKHPAFSDKAVRDAMSLLIDRKGISDFIYGRGGMATATS
jgi:peptide/nickel transport system substrate-binding protein